MARIVRYYGRKKRLDTPYENTTYNPDQAFPRLILPNIFNGEDEIVEVYGLDEEWENRIDDHTRVELLDVYIAGKRLEKEKIAEYDKEFGYYSDKHFNSKNSYVVCRYYWTETEIGEKYYWTEDRIENVLKKYEEEYFDKHTIKAPFTYYDAGWDLGNSCNVIIINNKFDRFHSRERSSYNKNTIANREVMIKQNPLHCCVDRFCTDPKNPMGLSVLEKSLEFLSGLKETVIDWENKFHKNDRNK